MLTSFRLANITLFHICFKTAIGTFHTVQLMSIVMPEITLVQNIENTYPSTNNILFSQNITIFPCISK